MSVHVFNNSFAFAASVYMAILYAFVRLRYPDTTTDSKTFSGLVLVTMVGCIMDAVVTLVIEHCMDLPVFLCKIGYLIYYFSITAVALVFNFYIVSLAWRNKRERVSHLLIPQAVAIVTCSAMVFNLYFGFFNNFSTVSGYSHGHAFAFMYMGPFIIAGCAMVNLFLIRGFFPPAGRVCMLLLIFVEFSGFLCHAIFFPNLSTDMFFASLAVLGMMFTVETPDYRKLLRTMEELKDAEAAAEAARNAADGANRSKSDFLASMSHEIRTPITSILGMDEMILRTSSDPEIVDYSRDIQNAGITLLKLVNDILDFSKIESGKMDLVESDYSLSDMLSSLYTAIGYRARKKKLQLEFSVDRNLPDRYRGDETRVSQVLSNLLDNAVKYTPQGSITLTVTLPAGSDHQVISSGSACTLVFEVTDTGIGIRKADLDKIFDSFERIDTQGGAQIEGTGLGLAISKRIVELMGGTIGVESHYGEGSTFRIEISQMIVDPAPLGDFRSHVHTAQKLRLAKKEASFFAPRARILVVDDNPMNLKLIGRLLARTQMQIDLAESGLKCLEKAPQTHYDVILLDHMMPDIDGIQTLHRLRSIPQEMNASHDTPVIALTANALTGIRESYLQEGFSDYLSKPVTGSDLENMVMKYLPPSLVEQASASSLAQTESSESPERSKEEVISDTKRQD